MKTIDDYAKYLSGMLCGECFSRAGVVSQVTCDSRQVKPGTLFCAIAGSVSDGHDYIKSAISNGAIGIIYSQDLEEYATGVSYLKVKQQYLAYAMACELFFDCPAKEVRLHGITGTNGKTTTAFLLEHILTKSSLKTGLITTVECRDGEKVAPSFHTTPEAWELQNLFRRIADNKCHDAVMEVSSHGLDQFRPGNAKFHTAIFTNLTGDHLDYHENMEKYFAAKKHLFSHYLAENGNAIINVDDEYGKALAAELQDKKVISYGQGEDADCRIVNLVTRTSGTDFELEFGDNTFKITSPLIGEYNAYNACAAFCAAVSSGIDGQLVADILSSKIKVPGRLEHFTDTRGVSYFVDYAHTDDALRNVLKNLRIIATKRIITVFGCGGNRDRSKRPRMAVAAAEYSDLLIITSDNPRKENPLDIIDEIKIGVPENTEFMIEADRKKAICLASELAKKGDLVLVAGKGHETYQDINGQLFDFDDRKIIIGICAT
jgi:UDP-N-acetylmuramoyl-L-alanyl-D-glutamate--2,6-diaminopimelate ligase